MARIIAFTFRAFRFTLSRAMRPRELARFWWMLDARVDRAAYLKHGFALAAVKYAGDAALVFAATGQLWTPFNYSDSLSTLLTTRLAAAPSWLMPALAVWMLPFLWAGVTLTVRRAVDAGWPAWCAVAFFIPYLNYLLIAALCLKGTSGEGSQTAVAAPVVSSFGRSAALATAVGAAIGLAMVAAAVPFAQTYGLALLFLTPFMIGTITGFVLNRRYDADGFETIWVTLGTFAAAGLATFAMSLEGAI